MTTLSDLCATAVRFCFQRGDTFSWTVTLKDEAGTAIDLTGNSYLFTVDQSEDPSTVGTQVFQLTGNVLTQSGATLGQVEFAISAANWTAFDAVLTAPAEAFYDLEQTDSGGGIRTIAKGVFEVRQDIAKS